jgi:serine phosphatase RsbU (regulator of sigma subunit)
MDQQARRPGAASSPALAVADICPVTRLDVGQLLAAVEDAPPVAAADVVGGVLAEVVGADEVAFLIADLSGRALIRLGHAGSTATRTQGRETAERVPLTGTSHGRVLSSQAIEVENVGDGSRVCAPVSNRGEAIGVLEVGLPVVPDDQCLADIALAAHALAYIVIANRRFTDLFAWGQRSVPLSLAAEIQHRLLPGAFTCEAGQCTLAGWLEPAGEIAGDTFDFALERDTLHLSMTDAMGHSVEAALLATVVVGALRNGRRAGVPLGEQAQMASTALEEHFNDGEFVTGQLARIDLLEGSATIVNAGHPPPLRLRKGQVERVNLEADAPFGIGLSSRYRVQSLPLTPGDRLIFLTDGVLERNAANLNLPALITQAADMHPREAVQHIIRALLEITDGKLQDDATIMCLDWQGGPPRDRTSDSGANTDPQPVPKPELGR